MGRRKLIEPVFRLKEDARGNFEVTWTDPSTGATRRKSCGTQVRKEAERSMPGIVAGIRSPAPPPTYKLGDLIEAYFADRLKTPHSKAFLTTWKAPREYFASYGPEQLNDAAFRAYREWRTKQPVNHAGARASKNKKPKLVQDATAVRELNALSGAIAWARRNRWKGLEGVKVHRANSPPKVRKRFLSQSEVRRLLDACIEPHTALFVRISIATGARMSAVLELTWDDVTFPMTPKGVAPKATTDLVAVNVRDDPFIEWRHPTTGELHWTGGRDFDLELAKPITLDLGQGRGNKHRGLGIIAPTNVGLYDALLRAYNRRKGDNVISWRGNKIGKVDLSDAYRRAGITGATQHTLKHTCISWMVQAGQSYENIGKLVGTSARTIERHYGHLSPVHLATVGSVLSLD